MTTHPDRGRITPSRRTFLSAAAVSAAAVSAAAVPLAAATPASASTPTITGPGATPHPQRPDRALRQLLREIDRHRIEATIRKLASFGTRHTLSAQDDPNRGIGAARAWLTTRFQQVADTSSGRMTVEEQSFVQPAGPRIPT